MFRARKMVVSTYVHLVRSATAGKLDSALFFPAPQERPLQTARSQQKQLDLIRPVHPFSGKTHDMR